MTWPELYASGVTDLGLSDEQFWRSTPRVLSAVADRVRQQDRDAWRRSAMVCAVIANANRDPKRRRKPYTEADFIGRDDGAKPKKKKSPDELLMAAQMANQALGGKDLRGARA